MQTIPPLSSLSASCCEVDCQGPAREHWAHLHTLGWGLLLPPSQPGPDAGFLHQEPPHHRRLRSLTHHWLPICYTEKCEKQTYTPSLTKASASQKCLSFTQQVNSIPHWHSSSWPSTHLAGPWFWHLPSPTASCHPRATRAEVWGLAVWIQAPCTHRTQMLSGEERKR